MKLRPFATVVLTGFAVLALLAPPAVAQISVGPNKDVLATGAVLLGNDISYDPFNDVYLSAIAYGTMWGAFITPAGDKISSFQIGSTNPSSPFAHYPRITYSTDLNGGTGGFLVAWHQDDTAANTAAYNPARTYKAGQLASSGGVLYLSLADSTNVAPPNAAFWQAVPGSEYVHCVVVAYPAGIVSEERVLSAGGQGGSRAGSGIGLAYSSTSLRFLVTWTTAAFGVQGRFVDATGAPIGAVAQYVSAGGGQEPSVDWNPATDEFGLAYGGFNAVASWIGFERVRASDGMVSDPATFGFAAGTFSPSVAVHTGTNHYIVGWSIGGGANSVEFDQNGVMLTGVRFLASRLGTPVSFDMSFNPVSGTFLAVSEDPRSIEVAGLELHSDGSTTGIAVGLSSGATKGSFVPRVTARTNAKEWDISYSRNITALANQIVSTGTTEIPGLPPVPRCWADVTFTPTEATIGRAGGTRTISVTAAADCAWTAQSKSGGVAIVSGGAGTGPGTVTYSIASNFTGVSRALSLSIAGHPFTMTQAGPDRIGAADFGGAAGGDAVIYDAASGELRLQLATTDGFTTASDTMEGTGWNIIAADMNGDGLADLFYYRPTTGDWSRRINNGDGTFQSASGVWRTNWNITPNDFNGDGRTDLFLYNATTGAWYIALSQDSSSAPFNFDHSGLWTPGWTVYAAEFTGDGRGDLFLFNRNGSGDPRSGLWYRVLTRSDLAFDYDGGAVRWDPAFDVIPADYNGDGLSDLFLYRPSGDFYRVRFTGAGQPLYDWVLWRSGWTLRKADFNGDGRADLLLHNASTGSWYEVITEADGSLSYYGGAWAVGMVPFVTDFNADGRADLLLYDAGVGTTDKAITTAPGAFTTIHAPVGFGPGWIVIATRIILP